MSEYMKFPELWLGPPGVSIGPMVCLKKGACEKGRKPARNMIMYNIKINALIWPSVCRLDTDSVVKLNSVLPTNQGQHFCNYQYKHINQLIATAQNQVTSKNKAQKNLTINF